MRRYCVEFELIMTSPLGDASTLEVMLGVFVVDPGDPDPEPGAVVVGADGPDVLPVCP